MYNGLTPESNLSTMQPLSHSSLSQWDGEHNQKKTVKLVGQVKNSLLTRTK